MTLTIAGRNVRAGFTLQIIAAGSGAGASFVICDATLVGATAGAGAAIAATPALDFVGSWIRDGAPGVEIPESEMTFHIAPRSINNQGTPMRPDEMMRASWWLGALVVVYLSVDDGSGWQEEIVGFGRIFDTEVSEDGLQVRISFSDWQGKDAPRILVGPDSMS